MVEPGIASNFFGLEIKDVILNTAIVATVFKVIWTIVSWALDHLRVFFSKRTRIVAIPLAPYKPEYESIARFRCLVIRYGTDQYLERLASDKERFDGRLKNQMHEVEKGKDAEGNYASILKLPVHKRIGTQFKCFADAASADSAPVLERLLRDCPLVFDVSPSASPKTHRFYFLLKEHFAVVETVDGIKNNFCYPV